MATDWDGALLWNFHYISWIFLNFQGSIARPNLAGRKEPNKFCCTATSPIKLSAQRNETDTKQFQNTFKTVFKQFWNVNQGRLRERYLSFSDT